MGLSKKRKQQLSHINARSLESSKIENFITKINEKKRFEKPIIVMSVNAREFFCGLSLLAPLIYILPVIIHCNNLPQAWARITSAVGTTKSRLVVWPQSG